MTFENLLSYLEVLRQDLEVVLLVEPLGVERRAHLEDLELPAGLLGDLGRLHAEPVVALRLLPLGLLQLLEGPLAHLRGEVGLLVAGGEGQELLLLLLVEVELAVLEAQAVEVLSGVGLHVGRLLVLQAGGHGAGEDSVKKKPAVLKQISFMKQ